MYISREQRKLKKQKQHEPKIIENTKQSLVIQGHKCHDIVRSLLSEWNKLRHPLSTITKSTALSANRKKQKMHQIRLEQQQEEDGSIDNNNNKKNYNMYHVYPFEDVHPIEQECKKEDRSLFVHGSHSKKRPLNVIMGRMHDHHLLDMIEMGVSDYRPMKSSAKEVNVLMGSKPMLVFQGDAFTNNEDMKRVKNLMLDFFRGDSTVREINVLGLDHVIVITATDEKTLRWNHYAVRLAGSGAKSAAPRSELSDIGPAMTLTLRRTRFAAEATWKDAVKIPQELRKSKTKNKNVSINEITGEREARIHVQQQEIGDISLRKFKATRKKVQAAANEELAEESARKKRPRSLEASWTAGEGDFGRFSSSVDPDEMFTASGQRAKRQRKELGAMKPHDALQTTRDEFM